MGIASLLKGLLPKKLKQAVLDQLHISKLREDVETLKIQMAFLSSESSYAQLWEKSKMRWRTAEPLEGLTWGVELSGDAFVERVVVHADLTPEKSILEIGPGYGRILKSFLKKGLPFEKYVGLDISDKNVAILKSRFANEKIIFLQGDVEKFTLDQKFDLIVSSLTFKHLFPTFERALCNLAGHMQTGGTIIFDLIEGDSMVFESETDTFMHRYKRDDVQEIAATAGLSVAAFEPVHHAPGFSRLLVVARKPPVFLSEHS